MQREYFLDSRCTPGVLAQRHEDAGQLVAEIDGERPVPGIVRQVTERGERLLEERHRVAARAGPEARLARVPHRLVPQLGVHRVVGERRGDVAGRAGAAVLERGEDSRVQVAPAIVQEVMDALVRLRGRAAMVIVEHHAETVLPIVERAYVLVNGQVAYEGSAKALEADAVLQARLLGIVHQELTAAE